MPPDKGIQIPAFSRPLQLRGGGMRAAMLGYERVIAPLSHDAFPIIAMPRHELPVPKPILGETTSEPGDRAPGEPANGDDRPVLLEQTPRRSSIAKGIERLHGIF